eukprot:UN28283
MLRLVVLLTLCVAFGESEETSNEQVGWGIIGLGYIANKLAYAINESKHAYFRAGASRKLEKAEEFVKKWGTTGKTVAYGNYDDLLNDELVSVVYIPLPTTIETDWVIKACKAGKHVLAD